MSSLYMPRFSRTHCFGFSPVCSFTTFRMSVMSLIGTISCFQIPTRRLPTLLMADLTCACLYASIFGSLMPGSSVCCVISSDISSPPSPNCRRATEASAYLRFRYSASSSSLCESHRFVPRRLFSISRAVWPTSSISLLTMPISCAPSSHSSSSSTSSSTSASSMMKPPKRSCFFFFLRPPRRSSSSSSSSYSSESRSSPSGSCSSSASSSSSSSSSSRRRRSLRCFFRGRSLSDCDVEGERERWGDRDTDRDTERFEPPLLRERFDATLSTSEPLPLSDMFPLNDCALPTMNDVYWVK
uniref:Uncharacterized protein n=1 Tax=Anopheles melas TaxID=34690 RepID=A0A182U251_9DIPT